MDYGVSCESCCLCTNVDQPSFFHDRDIAFRFQEFNQKEFGVAVDENVRLVDINPAMLKVGKQRAAARGYHLMSFEEGNAQDLKGTYGMRLI